MYPSPIPQELVDVVIDHLHNEKPALKACARVHSSWVTSSRHHLFHSLAIRKHTFHAVMIFLSTHSRSIGPSIRHLHLGPQRDNTLSFAVLITILSALPRLKAVHIVGVRFDGANLLTTCPPKLQLDLLVLGQVGFHSVNHALLSYRTLIYDVLALFSTVKELRVVDLDDVRRPEPFHMDTNSQALPLFPSTRLPVQILAMHLSFQAYNNVLHGMVDISRLTSFSATCMSLSDLRTMGRVVSSTARTLTHVGVVFRNFEPTSSDVHGLYLSTCQSLNSILLTMRVIGYTESPGSFRVVLSILSSLPSGVPLTAVAISVAFVQDMYSPVTKVQWGTLKWTLMRFGKLKKVSFEARRGEPPFGRIEFPNAERDRIERELKDLKESGQLGFR